VTSHRIAFATWSGHPDIWPDDRLAADELRAQGHTVVAAPWDAPDVRWGEFDAIVLRTTWNYHRAFETFSEWLDRLEGQNARIFNPLAMVRWNAHKRYLLELRDGGVAIPGTVLVDRGDARSLRNALDQQGWRSAVVKPAFGASADGIFLASIDDADELQRSFEALLAGGDVLIQELIPEIRTEGELSLMFFDGRFSHAVAKQPSPGEFRVQEHRGGRTSPARAEDRVIDSCAAILGQLESRPVYARVDGIAARGGWLLMELELIEPSLFLSYDDQAAKRFADTVRTRLAAAG
jgi:glutathione synthase/RimK-type ligase-like ATP-grasp enzyme